MSKNNKKKPTQSSKSHKRAAKKPKIKQGIKKSSAQIVAAPPPKSKAVVAKKAKDNSVKKPVEKKSLFNTLAKAAEKVFNKPPLATKPTPEPKKEAKKADLKADKKAKKDKKKAAKEVDDLEPDLLDDADDMGGEEIPDLAEFVEDEVEPVEDDSVEAPMDLKSELKLDQSDDEIILTDAEGRRYCRVRDCDQIGLVEGYCRFHYLFLWKKIQVRRKILVDGKLERYVEELTGRYPDKFLEMIRKDLKTEKDFLGAIAEMEIDDAGTDGDFEDEAQNYIDEVRGMTESPVSEDDDF